MKHSQEEYWRPRFHAPPLRSHPDPPPTIQCSWYPYEGQCPYMQRQQVCDELEITLYGSGIDDQSLTYHLNAAEKEVLREKMEAYCMQREHKPLEQLCQELLQEQDVPIQEMQL